MNRPFTLCVLLGSLGFSANCFAVDHSSADIQRGRYLATAGDCVACHTTVGGKPFAGGRPIETPFGTLYSPNITPDRETGIGAWNDEQFYNALHSGIDPTGRHLYPAFPYPYFTKLTRDDVRAIHAYLDTVDPVRSKRPASQLDWPLDYRFLLTGWNWLYFDEGTFAGDSQKSAEWNRGAYLVRGAGHCGACHTPKNFAGGDEKSQALEGGLLQGWHVPNITADRRRGIGSWTVEEIAEYLKTGRNAHSGATGLMAEVVSDSTSHLSDSDLRAIAVYLKDQPGHPADVDHGASDAVLAAGKAIYNDSCAACHQGNGKGVPHLFPPLAGSANVQAKDPTTLIRLVLQGASTVRTAAQPTFAAMPAYRWKLDDGETAAVLSYVRNQWGNAAPAVSADDVKSVWETLKPPVP
jgi:mono/diheme cytochrome c family protein